MPEIPLKGTPMMGYTGNPNNQYLSGAGYQSISGNTTANIGQTALAFQGIAAITDAAQNISGHFADRMQQADDIDAIHSARQMADENFGKMQADFQERTDYENFDKSFQDTAKTVNEGIKPMMQKASMQARQQIQNDIDSVSSGVGVRTYAIANQRRISDARDSGMNQVKWYVDRNDFTNANSRIDQMAAAGLLSKGEVEKQKMYFESYAEGNNVTKSIDTGFANTELQKLQARDPNTGNFINYSKVDDKQRDSLVRYAHSKYLEFSNSVTDQMAEKLMNGNLTENEVAGLDIEQGRKNQLIAAVRQKDKDFKAGIEKAQNTAWNNESESLAFEIARHKWDNSNADENNQYYNDMQGKILSLTVDDGKKKTIWEQLQREKAAAEKPDTRFESNPVYQEGIKIIDEYRKTSKLYRDPPGLWNKESSPDFQQARSVELLQEWNDYFGKNPNTNIEETQKYLKNRVKDLQDAKIKQFFINKFAPGQSSNLIGNRMQKTGGN